MSRIYFDITDVVQFAGRNTRLTGIQRVAFNIVTLLSYKHGGDKVRCLYYDRGRKAMFEVDFSSRQPDAEFDAERLLADLGLAREGGFFPTTVRIKSYLRNHARSKIQRALLKARLHWWSFVARQHLRDLDLLPSQACVRTVALESRKIAALPAGSHLVHLGSSWFFPEIWRFAAEHRARGGDVVQYVHDLIPVTHPQFMAEKEPPVFTEWLNHAMEYAARFLCNSQWTAQSLAHHAARHGRQLAIDVAMLAHEFMGYPRDPELAVPSRLAALAGKRFVLCVGTIEERKNGRSLLEAWTHAVAKLEEAPPALVFAGRYGKIGGAQFREALAIHARSSDVRIVDMPSDYELAWLYRNCLFSVYPSYVEGWGLPVGESAWFGKHCVASSASSIPEVCGALVDYVDPQDCRSIEAGLLRALTDSTFLKERERAISAARLRRWDDVADDLYSYVLRSST